jgi:hypothetical protein
MGLWDTHVRTIDPERFRAHDQYLEQRPEYPYREMFRYIHERGLYPLVEELDEDGAFGCETQDIGGNMVSRDLVDSILEITFLRESLGESWFRNSRKIVDIGAGYGRLVYRMSQVWPLMPVYATDAYGASLATCRKYLQHRGVGSRHVYERFELPSHVYDLAINVHSWSECTLDEICSWLDWLDAVRCARLYVVPHTPGLESWTPGGLGPSFRPHIEAHGFELEQHWRGPECNPRSHYLFKRT